MPLLLDILPKHIKIIDSGDAVARQTKTILVKNGLLNSNAEKAEHLFFTNGNKEVMNALLNDKFTINCLDF